MADIKRASLASVRHLLDIFPCVVILGARQVGKTTLLKQVLPDAPIFDLEKQADWDQIERDPDFFLSQYDQPIIVDEAQSLPKLFPALRVAIDKQRHKNGSYLLSGSSSPELCRKITESLAGRAAIFELSGFSMDESWRTTQNLLYSYLAKKDIKSILSLEPKILSKNILESCLFGSYPEPFIKHRDNQKNFHLWMENYFQLYLKRDVRNLFPGLKLSTYQRFVSMLAASSGQILNASEFGRSLDVSQPTVKSYFQIAQGTFVWRMLPSFQKNATKRLVKMPKGHMRDSGILNYILKNYSVKQLQSHPLYGRIWEAFITEEILKGFQNNLIPAEAYFYRTKNQAEIDLILEGKFGILPIEIKTGSTCPRKNVVTLETFLKERKLDLGIVVNNSQKPIWLSKHTLQIPASCL